MIDGLSCSNVSVDNLFEDLPSPLVGRIGLVLRGHLLGGESTRSPLPIIGASVGICPKLVRVRALGELIERVSGLIAGQYSFPWMGSVQELEEAGYEFIDPCLEVAHLWNSGDVPLGQDCKLSWIRGIRSTTAKDVMVPAQFTYLAWEPEEGEPTCIRPDATGLAAHHSGKEACVRAMLEVAERDSLIRSWQIPGWPVMRAPQATLPLDMLTIREALELALRVYIVGAHNLPPTVIACLSNDDGSCLTLGSKCGELGPATLRHAICEAMMLRWTLTESPPGVTAVEVFRDGSRVPRTSLEHVARAFTRGQEVLEWYEGQARLSNCETGMTCRVPGSVTELARRMESELGRVALVDVTESRFKSEGWTVIRCVASSAARPQMASLSPFLAQARVVRRYHSGRDARLYSDSESIHCSPHPFG